MAKEKSGLDHDNWPQAGGSYTRGSGGELTLTEEPTKAAEPTSMSEGSGQDEQAKAEAKAAERAKPKAKHK